MLTPAQREAVNPKVSAWVEASAGSGKTRVLVDRLLALMVEGADPERLLCLTFTKAAAAEMDARLKNRLSLWSHASNDDLIRELQDLGLSPNERRLDRARGLFQEVLNLLRGVRIQTLHSFCENFLRRFPLEAGVMPAFRVMDEHDARQLFNQNIDAMLNARRGNKDDHTLRAVSAQFSYAQLCEGLWTLSGQRRFAQGVAGVRHLEALQNKLGLHSGGWEDYVQNMLHHVPMDLYKQLLSVLEGQPSLSASASAKLERIAAFVNAPTPQTLCALTDVSLGALCAHTP
jgi:ATP-dependent helicase/nuclease subunit A